MELSERVLIAQWSSLTKFICMCYTKHASVLLVSRFLNSHGFVAFSVYLCVSLMELLHPFSACHLFNFCLRFLKVCRMRFFFQVTPVSVSHGNEYRKLKSLPVCDWIFSGIWELLSVIFIKAREMEAHALGRSSQVTAKLLLLAFSSWINFSLTLVLPHMFQEILRFQALTLFVQG